jgi:SAM-dependent methyltransferase
MVRVTKPTEAAIERSAIRYYGALAPRYERKYENPTMAYMRRVEWGVITRYLKKSAMRILDLGCGLGGYAIPLARRGNFVVGVDISEVMLRFAQERAQAAGVESKMQLVKANVQRLPAISPPFDLAVSTFGALNHVSDLGETFRSISNLLNEGAIFICIVANYWSLFDLVHPVRHTASPSDILRLQGKGFRLRTLRHRASWGKLYAQEARRKVWTRFYTWSEVETELETAGFQRLRRGGIFCFAKPFYHFAPEIVLDRQYRLAMTLEKTFRWVRPTNRYGANLVFVSRKRGHP